MYKICRLHSFQFPDYFKIVIKKNTDSYYHRQTDRQRKNSILNQIVDMIKLK